MLLSIPCNVCVCIMYIIKNTYKSKMYSNFILNYIKLETEMEEQKNKQGQ